MYPLTFLFIILSLYFLIQSLSQPKKTFFLPSLFAALAFYSDYSTIWFIFSLLISILILSRYSSIFHKYKSTLIKMLAATFLFITPQLVIFITNIFSAVQLQDWLQQYSLIQLVCNSGHQFMGIFQPNSIIIYGLYWIFLLFLLSSCIRHIPQSTSIKKILFPFSSYIFSSSHSLSFEYFYNHRYYFVPTKKYDAQHIIAIVYFFPFFLPSH